MALLTYVGTGSGTVPGVTNPMADYPAGIASGDLLVCVISNKYSPNLPTVPNGWTLATNAQLSAGAGAAGAGSGPVVVTVITKIADGTETGSLSLTVTSANSSVARMFALRRSNNSSKIFDFIFSNGSDVTGDTSWSVTAEQSLDLIVDDLVVACTATNEAASYTYTTHAFSQTDITFGARTQRTSTQTSGGDDCRVNIVSAAVTAGSGTAATTFTMTASGSTATAPTGPTVFMRVREIDAPVASNMRMMNMDTKLMVAVRV